MVEFLADQLVFDRNLMVLLVPGAVLLFAGPSGLAVCGTAWFPSSASGSCRFSSTPTRCTDAAVWDEANSLVARGVPATSIDAGLDWVATAGVPANRPSKRTSRELDFWEAMFPRSPVCYTVTVAPLHHRTPFERVPYRTFAVLGRAYLDVYRVDACPYRPGS